MFRINQGIKKFAVILAILALFFSLNAAFLEARSCERALWRCVNDPFLMANLGAGIYCLTGYLFCKKYIG